MPKSINLFNSDLDFIDPERRIVVLDFKKYKDKFQIPSEIKNILGWIGLLTFGNLHNILIEKYS